MAKSRITDEKRFNFDELGGLRYYYHDLRKEQQLPSRRSVGGDSITICRGIGYQGKIETKFIAGK